MIEAEADALLDHFDRLSRSERNRMLMAAVFRERRELLAACKRLLHAAGIGSGAAQAFATGSAGFIAHADQIVEAWKEVKAAVEHAEKAP
jgi:hypothetical protein